MEKKRYKVLKKVILKAQLLGHEPVVTIIYKLTQVKEDKDIIYIVTNNLKYNTNKYYFDNKEKALTYIEKFIKIDQDYWKIIKRTDIEK